MEKLIDLYLTTFQTLVSASIRPSSMFEDRANTSLTIFPMVLTSFTIILTNLTNLFPTISIKHASRTLQKRISFQRAHPKCIIGIDDKPMFSNALVRFRTWNQ